MLNLLHCINFTPRPNEKFKEPDEKEQQEVALPMDFCEYAHIHGRCSYNPDIYLFIQDKNNVLLPMPPLKWRPSRNSKPTR